MDYDGLLRDLERLLRETYELWDEGWVTFNWRGYTYDHVQRVRGLAIRLCREEGGDLVVTELAALLHDITKTYDGEYVVDAQGKRVVDELGYWRNEVRRPTRANVVTRLYDELALDGQLHNESGAVIAERLLSERGVPEETCALVARTIRDHLRPPDDAPIESRCLYDADTIDANIGLPAFVRNIYINLHFHDSRKGPDTPPIAVLLRDAPEGFIRPYVTENLPRWNAGKRRDFIPRLLTAAGRELSVTRLDRLDHVFSSLAQEAADFEWNSRHGCLAVVKHYMDHQGDPSIATETSYLAEVWARQNGASPQASELIAAIRREMEGVD